MLTGGIKAGVAGEASWSWSSCCRPPVKGVRISDWREAGPEAEEVALLVSSLKGW